MERHDQKARPSQPVESPGADFERGIEGYVVWAPDRLDPLGKVVAVVDRDTPRVAFRSLDADHAILSVPLEAVQVDHTALAVRLADRLDELDVTDAELVDGDVGAEGARVQVSPREAIGSPGHGPLDDPGLLWAGVLGAVALLSVLGILAVVGATRDPLLLGLLIVPAAVGGIAAYLASRSYRAPYRRHGA